MAYAENKVITIEDCQIMTNRGAGQFRNFSADATRFSPAGIKRFFNIVIPDAEEAERLIADGWNVISWTPNPTDENPDPETTYRLEVQIKFRDRMGDMLSGRLKPTVVMRCNGVQTLLDEDTVGELDGADIISADVQIAQSHWDTNGRTGVSAYLRVGYFNIELANPFAEKYANDERTIYGDQGDDVEAPF